MQIRTPLTVDYSYVDVSLVDIEIARVTRFPENVAHVADSLMRASDRP